jgi:hypothetical protein
MLCVSMGAVSVPNTPTTAMTKAMYSPLTRVFSQMNQLSTRHCGGSSAHCAGQAPMCTYAAQYTGLRGYRSRIDLVAVCSATAGSATERSSCG